MHDAQRRFGVEQLLARHELVTRHRQPVVAGDEAFTLQVELEIDELEVEAQDEARRGAG